MTPASTTPSQRKPEDDADGLEDIAVAGAAPGAARTGAPAQASRSGHEREVRALKARAEDQAGEIARLKAALAAFEQGDKGAGLKNSKLALKARVGSAEAQAERQAETINRLRAELAASNERLARQAAHFMDEMRRVGGGSLPATSGQPRRPVREGERRKLIERVAQVRPVLTPDTAAAAPPAEAAGRPAGGGLEIEKEAANGHDATVGAPSGEAMAEPAAAASAAEMPKTDAIPEPGRKLRLLDRITGLSKS
jgi:hypothetical protein